ncbi:MAG: radical SAM protein [Deltaproteobacteria bacterium]|nr:radical SAM protein [Deltaproteobacteria bacterium]
MTKKAWRKERIAGLLENRPRVGPQTVHFDLANACNTRCVTCWHHSPHLVEGHRPTAAWKKQVLPLARFAACLEDLAALGGLESIILSGMGDPTLNDDLYAMVADASGRGLHVTIITNGLRLEVSRLMEAIGVTADGVGNVVPNDRLDLLFSVCGVSEPAWQAFHAHPRPDGFQTMEARLGELAAYGFRPKHVQVICAANVHEVPAMIDFAHARGAKAVSFKLASLAHGTEAAGLSPEQKAALRDVLVPAAMARAEALGVETDLAAFRRQIHDDARTAPIEDVGCFMGFLYARVTVLGEVLFCCNTAVPVGDLRDSGLAAMWHGERWQSRRDSVRRGAYFAGCDQCGKLKQNLKWSERLQRELPANVFAGLLGRGGA